MARVRVRQHVNPLSYKYRNPIKPPSWEQIYNNPRQLLHLDIGCARGKFLLNMAQIQPEINFLGIEIRESLVIEANQYREQLGLNNLHFLFGNINISPTTLFQSFPANILQTVSIQFPDPWFKNRHLKRRMVQPGLVLAIAECLRKEGHVFLQSDIEEVAKEMSDRFLENSTFMQQHSCQWLADNPFPVATEREIATFNKNQSVYRTLLKKR